MTRRKKVTQKDVIEGFRHLALGEIHDAVTLLLETDEEILKTLPELDLFNVSEIKKAKGGGMEIKFFDRLKALEKLSEAVSDDGKHTAVSFYEALEKSAKSSDISSEDDAYD